MQESDMQVSEETALNPEVLRGADRADLLREECLADILTASARRRPHHPALVWGKRVVTYGDLDTSSQIIGAALASRGAAPGQVVGLFMPRGADVLIAQAAITRSGAAWLPFDAETPLERTATCLESAQACGLVTCREWLPRLAGLPVPVWAVEDLLTPAAPTLTGARSKPSDPAYVIYTSGSTGKPKGIVISHQSICHFLRSENEFLGVQETDRVYQGFSLAFDMSFEEIWISYLAGATVWVAPASLVGDPDLLAETWTRERITVVHAVPTLMGLIDDPLPTVRLINLGGEACPNALAARLARPGRKVFNTYGPTEACVSASLLEVEPDKPVTIGLPLPNYGLLVVDGARRPLPAGEVGELGIFGPGLALGYLGQPELTASRFIPNPAATNHIDDRLFLTGDLARIEPGGPVHWLGRADNQVKIRGYRVELDEIASAVTAHPGVAAAAAVVRPLAGLDQLVGFVVPAGDDTIDHVALRQALAARLPAYMVPTHLEVLAELPRLPSGKTDLHALRAMPVDGFKPNGHEPAKPRNDEEAALYAALNKLFTHPRLRPDADFFDDLGGHSLLAARLVSSLRNDPRYAALSVQDVYRQRQLGKIAGAMQRQLDLAREAPALQRAEVPWQRRILCGMAQAVIIPFFVLFHMADWLTPFFVYHYFTGSPGDSILRAVMYSLATFLLARFATFGLAIVGKLLVARRLPPGRFPLWGVTYFRWWLVNKFCELPDVYLLAASPWMPLYLRALGARIGRDVIIDAVTIGAPSLLTVEDGVSIGTFVNIENARVEGGSLVLGPVHLRRASVVDSYAVLENDTELGERARLGGQSALKAGRRIPADENWEGAPARRVDRAQVPLPPRPQVGLLQRWTMAAALALSAMVVSVLFFLPTFPAFMLIDWMDANTFDIFESNLHPLAAFGIFFLMAIPASALFVLATMLLTAGLRWLLPRQTPGLSTVHSVAFWHKKFMTMVQDTSLSVLHGIYASVYAPAWLRLLGAKVGRHAEVSTAEGIVPELLTLGDDSFIADGAMLGDEQQQHGWMVLQPTQIGHRSFIGNGAYVPDGTTVPDDVLIGVQTSAPANAQFEPGQTWIGSPPLLLPARERLTGFDSSLTFRPSLLRRLGRGLVEGLRIVLPLAFVIAAGYLIIVLVMPMTEGEGWEAKTAIALSIAGYCFGFGSFLLVVALKWILIGRYRPRAAPMWTPFVWLSEAVTNLYESLAVPNFLNLLRGTPWLPWALRLLGVRIGKGVYMNTTDLTEFDCVRIGDEAELNAWCGPQTHLFEDRIMKIGMVEIGARATLGVRSIVLYDTQVGDGARLGPLTLVVKGERLPAGTCWEGSPAVRARDPSPRSPASSPPRP
jgi:non-ribosomal peptide synthetase-like protein